MAQADKDDGVRVVLSAPQLAAVLARESISRTEMLSNQLWGGLQVVGGVLEMVGAGVLCVMPEPTMASKIGCVAFGAHGSDTAAAGLRQIWTGLDTATLTRQGTTKLAEVLNVDPAMADNIGLSVDIAVPFGFAGSLKAARAAQVTMGRIRLEMHEARAGSRVGGHTIAKHVGRTEAQLRERLMHEPDIRAVSSFVNLEQAEWAISRVLQIHAQGIQAWAHGPGRRAPLTLMQRIAGNIGYGIVRKEGKLKRMNRVKVVLKFESHNDMPHYIVTAYLE
ncbi:hypothetical protein C7405_112152 [Paraburkholderia caballeronis]|uniref:RNase A-like domain-containing protein n=1 Tax=Paraburkholderia caballeronis TaxID=416943 RepID=UPI0010665DD9|nr:RNase A-like domain-containing protein [Paraburkholderia caballeronis]TDV32840.1 hypothetical protein C7405_112152 [Paraburkholderia caballeronis]